MIFKKVVSETKTYSSTPISKVITTTPYLNQIISNLIQDIKSKRDYESFNKDHLIKDIIIKLKHTQKNLIKNVLYPSLKGLIAHQMKTHLQDSKTIIINPPKIEDDRIYKWVIIYGVLSYSDKFMEDGSGKSKVFHTDLTPDLKCDFAGEFKLNEEKIEFNLDSGRFDFKRNFSDIIHELDTKRIQDIIQDIIRKTLRKETNPSTNLFEEFEQIK